jgi:hypothetical protein
MYGWPSMDRIRQAIAYWKSEDAAVLTTDELRASCIAELEGIAARLCALTN